MTRKRIVEAAFSAAAKSYDQAAEAQARAADLLVELVRNLALPPAPAVLEIGCGTGLLTRRLLPLIGGDWQVTDLSAAMVAEAQTAIGCDDQSTAIGGNAQFRVMDGEHPDLAAGSVDLIVSNLAAQWFTDLPAAIGRLARCVRPGGALALTTLGAGSFAEWKTAHQRLGLACGIPPYPSAKALAAQLPGAQVRSQPVIVSYADGRDFLSALKRIGAATPAEGHRPLSPGALRRVLKAMGAPAAVTYDVVTILLTRGS